MKTVNFPITVPSGDFCWEYSGKRELCEYFENEGGHSTCTLGFYDQKDTKDGVKKDPKCAAFVEVS